MNQPKLKAPGTGTPQSKVESKSHELPSGTAMAVGAQIAATPDSELPNLGIGRVAHTPGPWRTDRGYIESSGFGILASIYDDKRSEAKADAHLMAAAPELLEMLRALVIANTPANTWTDDERAIYESFAKDDASTTFELQTRMIESARAAIAKAEGRNL